MQTAKNTKATHQKEGRQRARKEAEATPEAANGAPPGPHGRAPRNKADTSPETKEKAQRDPQDHKATPEEAKSFRAFFGPILAESDCLDHRHSFSCVGGFNTRG